jgi:hypothetical protein
LMIELKFGNILDAIELFKSLGPPKKFDENKFSSNYLNIMLEYNDIINE